MNELDGTIYQRTLVGCDDGRAIPSQIIVTEEINCFVIWYRSHDIGLQMYAITGKDGLQARENMIDRAYRACAHGVERIEEIIHQRKLESTSFTVEVV